MVWYGLGNNYWALVCHVQKTTCHKCLPHPVVFKFFIITFPRGFWALSMEKQCCLVLYFKYSINILESISLSDSGFANTISHFAFCYINLLLLWKNTWEYQKEENVYFSTCIQRFQTMVAWLNCSSSSCEIFYYANRMC